MGASNSTEAPEEEEDNDEMRLEIHITKNLFKKLGAKFDTDAARDTPSEDQSPPPPPQSPLLPSSMLDTPPEEEEPPEVIAKRQELGTSKKVGEFLLKHEEEELEKVQALAKEFNNTYSRPAPRESPCRAEHDACLDCYKENMQDPLKCAGIVDAFAQCAKSSYEEYVSQ